MHTSSGTTSLRLVPLAILLIGAFALTGCETRPISDSGYGEPYGWRYRGASLYKGELSELDVLGVAPQTETSQADIAKALETAVAPRLKRGDKVLLIQSGATVPDEAMLEEAKRCFEVAPFSGVPTDEGVALSGSLRLRAAQGGYRHLVCYWGVLESARENQETKAISWVPIIGGFIPDQKQRMRLRLKAIVLDVGTGGWKMLTPEVYDDFAYNSDWNRAKRDQYLVSALKDKGYKALVADLLK